MDLNKYQEFAKLDPDGMLGHIDGLPEQFEGAWKLGLSLDLPKMSGINSVVIAGMGGSAIGADLVAATFADVCRVPVFVQRDYGLPAWAKGPGTLAVLSSHSGNTEETLAAFDQAVADKCQIVTVSTGGKLLDKANKAGLPAWTFIHAGQPRAAVGFSYGLLLAMFARLGLIADPAADVDAAFKAMVEQRKSINAESPLAQNPAKRTAGQLVGRYPTFFGAAHMAPVARRWKCQVNEVSKALAAFEALPESDHNTLAGVCSPEGALEKAVSFFIRSESDHPRVALRFDLTQKIMMEEGICTDGFMATGKSRMEQLWRGIQFGDFVSFYLAMAYDTDPTAIPTILGLKDAMSK
jgi:glucose/mannose-6-phosphate isomerase